jgi:copper resistance protein B
MTRALLLAGLAPFAFATPALAQSMDHSMHNMPGMKMPAEPAAKPAPKPKPKAAAQPAPKRKAPTRTAPPRRVKPAPAPAPGPHAGHDMSGMQGMDMGGQRGTAPAQSGAPDPHAGHDMSAMSGMTAPARTGQNPHAGHDMPGMQMQPGQPMIHDMPGKAVGDQPSEGVGTDLPPGDKPAPAPSQTYLADRYWGAEAMADSRENDLRREHGGGTFHQVMFNLAEYQVREGRDGFRWDGEAWYGGDINRLTVKTEGSGAFGEGMEDAEVQALYSRAVGPYFNLQAGVRYDFKPNPSRTYASVGFEGLAPYWFDVEGALFLSDKGDVLGRLEGYYDQRITQRLILQPRAELNFAAQDVRENGIGSGLSDAELGLRLRYEIRREFAPYVGVSWERSFGDTRRFARAEGEDTGGFSFVAGIRTWF